MSLLLESGADPESKDGGGETSLSSAASRKHENVLELLQSYITPSNWINRCSQQSAFSIRVIYVRDRCYFTFAQFRSQPFNVRNVNRKGGLSIRCH